MAGDSGLIFGPREAGRDGTLARVWPACAWQQPDAETDGRRAMLLPSTQAQRLDAAEAMRHPFFGEYVNWAGLEFEEVPAGLLYDD